MALLSPAKRIWWNEPLHRMEVVWITIAFLWGLVMFFTMIYWHIYGEQNLSNEAYRIAPAVFAERTEAMVEQHTVRHDEFGTPVVRPPVGEDVYLLGRLWDWYPILELEKDQSYRMRISSLDWQHGLSIQPTNINLQIHPGYEMVLTVTPNEAGEFGIVCNEYCGIGHHLMTGKIYVVESGAPAQAEEAAAPTAAAAAEAGEGTAADLHTMVAEADPADGETAARVCVACHTFEQGGANRVGPNLYNVAHGEKAFRDDFNYSDAIRQAAARGEVWDIESLDAFLRNPAEYAPGTTMVFAGVRNPSDRAALIAYLRQMSDDPPALDERGNSENALEAGEE